MFSQPYSYKIAWIPLEHELNLNCGGANSTEVTMRSKSLPSVLSMWSTEATLPWCCRWCCFMHWIYKIARLFFLNFLPTILLISSCCTTPFWQAKECIEFLFICWFWIRKSLSCHQIADSLRLSVALWSWCWFYHLEMWKRLDLICGQRWLSFDLCLVDLQLSHRVYIALSEIIFAFAIPFNAYLCRLKLPFLSAWRDSAKVNLKNSMILRCLTPVEHILCFIENNFTKSEQRVCRK